MRERTSLPKRPPPARRPPPEPAPTGVLALQRTAGNRAVARLLARPRPAADLPAAADNLLRYREGAPRLRALAALAAPPVAVDLAPALAYLRELTETLQLVEPLADPSALVFESTVVTGHDAEYGQAETRSPALLAAALAAAAPIARDLGARVARAVLDAVNDSSVLTHGAGDDPRLPTREEAVQWRELARGLAGVAQTVDRGGAGLHGAGLACEDAALSILQARAVLEARTTWRSGAPVSVEGDIATPGRAQNEADDIFADSGFGGRQSLRSGSTKREDWCGMFAAANLFRASALDKDLRLAFAHTDNVFDFFTYNPSPTRAERTPRSIWADGQWWGVKEYHAAQGLLRRWIEGPAAGDDIRPGDVALIRHTGVRTAVGVADHIVMVESFDAATGKLVTIEGNVHEGLGPAADGSAERTASGDLASSTTARGTTRTVVEIRDLNDRRTTTPGGAGPGGTYQERGGKTVFGIGRPSLLDFEHHDFGTAVVPEAYKYLSPEEIRRTAAATVPLVKHSTVASAPAGPYHTRAGH